MVANAEVPAPKVRCLTAIAARGVIEQPSQAHAGSLQLHLHDRLIRIKILSANV
jgi:hypothetical protein